MSNYRESKKDILDRITFGKKTIRRGGDIIFNLLKKESKFLTGKEALEIMNTYGIRTETLVVLFATHGISFNEEEYAELLENQVEISLNSRVCNE